MKTYLYNTGYFFKETGKIIKLNLLSNLFSVIGTALILLLLGLAVTGANIGNHLVNMLNEEAEINGYFSKEISPADKEALVEKIREIYGVRNARFVNEEEAKKRMENILGEEASILELFEENPFEAFVEIRINVDAMESILENVKNLNGIEYVRDNKEVLEKIKDITYVFKILGYLMIAAVGITTIIILSHMIRQGIYNNREQINTLRLLGSPGAFIGFPYVLTGILLTILGGLLATVTVVFLIKTAYEGVGNAILFIPLPSRKILIDNMVILIPSLSFILGLSGSLFGLSSIRKK